MFIIKKKSLGRIAQLLQRSKSFVLRWVTRYKELGIKGLNDIERPGRPTKLPRDFESDLISRLILGPTSKDGYTTFNAKSIKGLIYSEFGYHYSLSGTYALLHRLGLALIIPRPQHEKNDSAAMEYWTKDTLPNAFAKICKEFAHKKVELWFQDEMRFGEKIDIGAIWSLKGSQIRQQRQLGYRNSYIFGAVNPNTGERVGLSFSECNTEVMNIHLKLISQQLGADRHALLIVDCAGWHEKSKKLIVPTNITLLSLPPYSPELNPVERLWRWLKNNFLKNRLISKEENLEELGAKIWNKLSDKIVMSISGNAYKAFRD